MSYLFYIALGLTPSILWLLFYLREDCHPESKKMILRAFFLGILSVAPAAAIQLGIKYSLELLSSDFFAIFFLVILSFAATEEILKYFVVKLRIIKNQEFDEPIDAMIYLIVTALGFAAAENVLLLFSNFKEPSINPFLLILGRFIGATLLHTLASGILGYFLAISIYKKSRNILILGISLAVIFHGFYNLGINYLNKIPEFSVIYLAIILSSMTVVLHFLFRDLKKMQSVCK